MVSVVPTNRPFTEPADDAAIERTAAALRANGFEVLIADDRETARRLILEMIPEGAEVSQGASRTLEDLGVTAEIEQTGRYDAIRPRTRAMDRTTQLREMRKLAAGPDYWLNSVAAVTESGELVIASNTGSNLGPIAFGGGKVILAIGAQKIVPDLETAFRRVEEHSLPLESARLREVQGVDSALRKILIVKSEHRAGRMTVVLIREAIGF